MLRKSPKEDRTAQERNGIAKLVAQSIIIERNEYLQAADARGLTENIDEELPRQRPCGLFADTWRTQ
jgi:hypothetical protein